MLVFTNTSTTFKFENEVVANSLINGELGNDMIDTISGKKRIKISRFKLIKYKILIILLKKKAPSLCYFTDSVRQCLL